MPFVLAFLRLIWIRHTPALGRSGTFMAIGFETGLFGSTVKEHNKWFTLGRRTSIRRATVYIVLAFTLLALWQVQLVIFKTMLLYYSVGVSDF